MKAAVLRQYGKLVIEDRNIPVFRDDEVLVKVKYASICGSDQHIFRGEFHPRTRLPLVPGHEFSGIVEAAGSRVEGIEKGEKVCVDPIIPCGTCEACKRNHFPACTSLKLIGIDLDGGFADYISVKPSMIYKLGAETDLKTASLIELLSIGFHAVSRSGFQPGDKVAVYGSGKVGQAILHAVSVSRPGKIFMVDILDERLDMVRRQFPQVNLINAHREDPSEIIRKETGGEGVDIAFEAIGHYAPVRGRLNPVRSCIKSIRGGGMVCVLGLSDEPAEILMKELIWKEGKIVSSRVSHGEFATTIRALKDKQLHPASLITSVVGLDEIQEAFLRLEKEPGSNLKTLIEFD